MHLKAYETLKNVENINFNIKFMIEGEEECGSDSLEDFVVSNKEKLTADVIVISDTSIINNENPSITIGLRGLSYMEVELTGPNRDLHSGTYGGAVNDADDIRTRILDFEIPIYVWINKDAASAGALISIACDSIYMSSGASIGAATVVTGDGTQAPDKYQSYMRSIMRSTAEAKGRDPKIAEAMVDEDIEVDSISMEGKVITFSTKEAIKYGFCDAELNSVVEIMERQGIEDYEITKI